MLHLLALVAATPIIFLDGQSELTPFGPVPVETGKLLMGISDDLFDKYIDQKYGNWKKTRNDAFRRKLPILDLSTVSLPDSGSMAEFHIPNRQFIVSWVDSKILRIVQMLSTPEEWREAERAMSFAPDVLLQKLETQTYEGDRRAVILLNDDYLMKTQVDRYRKDVLAKKNQAAIDAEEKPVTEGEAARAKYITLLEGFLKRKGWENDLLSFINVDDSCIITSTVTALINLDQLPALTEDGGELGQRLVEFQNPGKNLFQSLNQVRKLMGDEFSYREGEMIHLTGAMLPLSVFMDKFPHLKELSTFEYVNKEGDREARNVFPVFAVQDTSLESWMNLEISRFIKPPQILIIRIPLWFRWSESKGAVEDDDTSQLPSAFPRKPVVECLEMVTIDSVRFRLKSTVSTDLDLSHAMARIFKRGQWWEVSDGIRRAVDSPTNSETHLLFYERE